MREAGVPVKRIAASGQGRTSRCASSSPTPAGNVQRLGNALRPAALPRRSARRSPVGLAAGESIRAIAGTLGRAPSTVCREVNANGGRKKYRSPGGRPVGVLGGRCGPSGPSWRSAGGFVGPSSRSRGQVVTSTDLGVVGSGVPRSSGDAGVPRDHLPVALRPEPWCTAQRAALVSAKRSRR